MPTNYNNKLSCDAFVHIDQAPQSSIPERLVKETIIEIYTKDSSHPPVKVKLMDICRISLAQVRDAFTYPSHGLDGYEYYKWYQKEHPEANSDTKLAVYFYKKHSE